MASYSKSQTRARKSRVVSSRNRTLKFQTLAVAVTGGIGSGKTEACKVFGSMGARILFADQIAKEIIATDAKVRVSIRKAFGSQSFRSDGSFDRRLISSLIFTNKRLKHKLEAIVHPKVLRFIKREIDEEKHLGRYPLMVVEAALIYESGADRFFDIIILVESALREAILRVMRRDSISRREVEQRLRSQMTASEKASRADIVLRNSGGMRSFRSNCRFLFSLLEEMALKEEET